MVQSLSFLPGIVRIHRDPAKKNASAGGMRRAATMLTGAASAALLGACSGSLPVLSDANDAARELTPAEARADAVSTRAARAAVAAGKPRRMPAVTVQQILTEWGTMPYTKATYRRRAPTPLGLPQQDYTMSLQEIMDDAVCRSCEDKPYHEQVLKAAHLHGVPPALIHAVIQKESAYNPAATSRRQARGLMQVTPGTGRYMGVADSRSLYDPQTNINAGTAYLKYLMSSHDSVDEVLAAYNSGPGNVRKYNGVPPFNETRRYVRDVKKFFASTATTQKE